MMPLKDPSPAELIGAIEANMAEFWKCFGRLPGAQLHDEPDLLWFATGVPDGSLNGVIRSQFADEEADSRIEETVAYFERRRLPMQWWVGPSSRPADLGKRLEARGLAARPWGPPGMAVDLDRLESRPAPPGPDGSTCNGRCDREELAGGFGGADRGAGDGGNRAGRTDAPLRRAAGRRAGGRFVADVGGRASRVCSLSRRLLRRSAGGELGPRCRWLQW